MCTFLALEFYRHHKSASNIWPVLARQTINFRLDLKAIPTNQHHHRANVPTRRPGRGRSHHQMGIHRSRVTRNRGDHPLVIPRNPTRLHAFGGGNYQL